MRDRRVVSGRSQWLVVLLAASPLLGAPPKVDVAKATTTTSFTSTAFERSPAGRKVREILVLLPPVAGGQPVAGAELGVGSICKTLEPGSMPPGWICNDSGKGVNLSGPPLPPGKPITAGFQPPIGHKFDVPLGVNLYGGDKKTLVKEKVPLQQLNAPILQTDPKRAIRLPQRISPGDKIQFRPIDPKFTPGGGDWKIGGLTPKWNGSFDRPLYDLELPPDFDRGVGLPLKVSYVDPWKTTLVDGPARDVVVAPPLHPPGDEPRVIDCSPQALTGTTFCVCGDFPPGAAADLLINGESVGEYLVSSSPTILNYSLPSDFPVGPIELSSGKKATIEIADGARGVVIRVNGEIDRDKLQRGESTELKLWLDGTEEKVELRLWNSTPAIVSLEGGEDQVVSTAGGSANDVTRTVNAVMTGDFSLHFELDVGTCPCANETDTDQPGDGDAANPTETDTADAGDDQAFENEYYGGGPPQEKEKIEEYDDVVPPELLDQFVELSEVWIDRIEDSECRDAAVEAVIDDMVRQQRELEKLLDEMRPKIQKVVEAMSLGLPVTYDERFDLDRFRELERMVEWMEVKIVDWGLLPRCDEVTTSGDLGDEDAVAGGGKGGDPPPPASGGVVSDGGNDEKKEPDRCGPDITTAFEELLTRVTRRIHDLPVNERGPRGGRDFLERNGPPEWTSDEPVPAPDAPAAADYYALEWNSQPVLFNRCGLPGTVCGRTAWLWGQCVPAEAVGSLLGGIVEGLLGVVHVKVDAPSGRAIDATGYDIGAGAMADHDLHTKENWEKFVKSTGDGFGKRLEGNPLYSAAPCRGCERCEVSATFSGDWTSEDWELANGDRVKADGSIVEPEKDAL